MESSVNRLLKYVLFIICALCVCIKATAQEEPITAREKKVLKLINTLPEVMEASKYIEKKTQGQRDLKTYIENAPTATQPYYVLSVREFNGMNLVPHFWFYVNPKNYYIRYWDPANPDKSIPLKQWQKLVRERKNNTR